MTDEKSLEISGINFKKGLPQVLKVSSGEIREVLEVYVNDIIRVIRETLEITPPELAGDIFEKGIWLTGGGALLKGLDRKISKELNLIVRIVEDPLYSVARGMSRLTTSPKKPLRNRLGIVPGKLLLKEVAKTNG